MSTSDTFPGEADFVKRGFTSSTDKGDTSYVRQYDGGRKMTVTLSDNKRCITVTITENDLLLASMTQDKVTRIEPESLNYVTDSNREAEQEIFRVYIQGSEYFLDIFYQYQPAFFYGDPRELLP